MTSDAGLGPKDFHGFNCLFSKFYSIKLNLPDGGLPLLLEHFSEINSRNEFGARFELFLIETRFSDLTLPECFKIESFLLKSGEAVADGFTEDGIPKIPSRSASVIFTSLTRGLGVGKAHTVNSFRTEQKA